MTSARLATAFGALAILLTAMAPMRYSSRLQPIFDAGFQTSASAVGPRTTTPTFTRATASTRYLATAVVDTATPASGAPAIGIPVIYASGVGTLTAGPVGVLLRDGTTALLLRNDALDNAAWNLGAATVTADTVADPAGTTTADRVEDTSGAAVQAHGQTVTVAADTTTYTAAAWIRCTSAHTAALAIAVKGGGGCTATTSRTSFSCSTTAWTKYDLTKANATCTDIDVYIEPTDQVAGSTGHVDVWGVQLYAETKPLSVEPITAGSTVTINTEDLTYASVPLADQGTVCTWYWHGANAQATRIDLGAALQFYAGDATPKPSLQTSGCADNMAITGDTAFSTQDWHHVCATWDQANAAGKLYVDGTEVTYSATDRAWTAGCIGTTGTLDMVAGTMTSHEYALAHFRIFRRPLTTAEITREYRRFAY